MLFREPDLPKSATGAHFAVAMPLVQLLADLPLLL